MKHSHEDLIGRLSGLLTRAGYRMATAESCTGGMIAALCTDVAGSSDWFTGGIVAYSNEIKKNVLGVPGAVIAAHGAVSGEVVRHMALGALHVMGAEAVVAVSGVAGPGGGTELKPVGCVWSAVAVREKKGACAVDLANLRRVFPDAIRLEAEDLSIVIAAIPHHFKGSRAEVREAAARETLRELALLLDAGGVG
ncbi:Competence/damage-inducible protein CinA protein, truncation [uncultured delta proteobacterium]|uniref:Competence/damage-inducible protein CinA protein, truncation n=1 Tax=uncultured delta proteobacterium TaxID=34034 RepID=A0A212KCQ6_9DELT|nr:Competence/damage-inducible protein CinA protein, truncation [uncultured delta proteobacterium]